MLCCPSLAPSRSNKPDFVRSLILLAAASFAAAQAPSVRDINIYGARKVSADRILRAANLRPGDPLPRSKGDLEDAIGQIPAVFLARVEAVCCDGSDAVLFIGIEERGSPFVSFRSVPAGRASLPEELVEAYRRFLAAAQHAVNGGSPDAASARDLQQQFTGFAETHLTDLREVLANAAEPEQRAIAAAVIAYSPNKREVVNDLQLALQDPDESVRNGVLPALAAIAVLAAQKPGLGIKISPTWLIELLNSLVLGDRLQSVDVLLTLTDTGDRAVLDQIRTRALPALVEMARWPTLRYALPPFVLVGRIAGLKDAEVQRRWSNGEREAVIDKALATAAGVRKGR
jgi:hypothetical protein